MRKLLITIALCLPSLTVLADADKKPSSTWFRSSTDHYQYYSTGDKEYGIQASMRLVDNSKKAKAIDFRLVWENEKFCSDHKDKEGVIATDTYYVNDEPVSFTIVCYKKTTINTYPSTKEGLDLVLRIFDQAKGNKIVFVKQVSVGKDVVYSLPSEGFSDFYREIKKASKTVL
ncbi:MAG: hypothetical protein GW890_02410 [Vibrio sp.]|nr:hypothetical protein [Vibrio sp.]